jgi:5-formyltetrahydrofolate cyclo-ligase
LPLTGGRPSFFMDLDAQKNELRKLVRGRMPRPGTPEFDAASQAAQERLASRLLREDEPAVIGLYRALKSECATAALAELLTQMGREVAYPVVRPGERALEFRRGDRFALGALGIEEPTGEIVELSRLELLVVPAVAVDSAGRRLGRGRGHYDATLAACECPAVALVFESQLAPEVPVGEHDRRVGAVCTEARFIVCQP